MRDRVRGRCGGVGGSDPLESEHGIFEGGCVGRVSGVG